MQRLPGAEPDRSSAFLCSRSRRTYLVGYQRREVDSSIARFLKDRANYKHKQTVVCAITLQHAIASENLHEVLRYHRSIEVIDSPCSWVRPIEGQGCQI